MADAIRFEPFRAFRFEVHLDEDPISLSVVRHRSEGLIIGVAHVHGRPTLFTHFCEYDPKARLVVMLTANRPEPENIRTIVYELGEGAKHLAVSCDNVENSIAFDQVLFPNAKLISLVDSNRYSLDSKILLIKEKLTDAKAMGYRINVQEDMIRDLHAFHGPAAVEEFDRSITEMIAIEEFIKVGGLSVEEATTKVSNGERPTTGWFAR